MRAIILSAGQGRRLLPHTADIPKCLVSVDGVKSILELQLEALAACGIREATVMLGFGADKVESHLARRTIDNLEVRTKYNPFYRQSDNLVTCWLAASEMTGGCLLLNGDTLFETAVLARLLVSPYAPVSVVIDRKREYTDDDMKVTLGPAMRLLAVSKTIPAPFVNGESIGLIRFLPEGSQAFRAGLERAIRDPEMHSKWYLEVLSEIAQSVAVQAVSIEGLWWTEIDSASDLADVREEFATRAQGLTARPKPESPEQRSGVHLVQAETELGDVHSQSARPHAAGRFL
jgi:choline kinase